MTWYAGPRATTAMVALVLPALLGLTLPGEAPDPDRGDDRSFHATFEAGRTSGFEAGPGWEATIVDDAHRGNGALRLTLVSELGLAGPAARVSVGERSEGPWFLTGWAKGTPDARVVGVAGDRSSAPVTLDGTWQAFGVTTRSGGELTVELVPDGPWSVGRSLVLDSVKLARAEPREVTVRPGTRIIEVDGDPFTVMGTNYNTSQIGSEPYTGNWAVEPGLCQSDAHLFRGAGVNTLRIWGSHPADSPEDDRLACLDAFAANGIGVLWLIRGPALRNDPAQVDPAVFQEVYWDQIQAYVADYAWHPATLFWSINNEVEAGSNATPEGRRIWFGEQGGERGMLDVLTERTIEADPHHLVGTAISDRCWEGYGAMLNANVPHLQWWGLNLYPNPPERLTTRTCGGVPFYERLNEDPRPKFLNEFGLDRYRCVPGTRTRPNVTNPNSPFWVHTCEAGSGEMQEAAADWLVRVWDAIAPELATPENPLGAMSGGLQFKWGDDWWGVLAGLNPAQSNHVHEVTGVQGAGQMGRIDGVQSGEWIGIAHAPDDGVTTPRPTTLLFDGLAERWRGPGPTLQGAVVEPLADCGAHVTWTTSEPATSELNGGVRELVTNADGEIWSDSTRYRRVGYDGALVTEHELVLTDLAPGVEHHLVPRSFTADGRSATVPPLSFTC